MFSRLSHLPQPALAEVYSGIPPVICVQCGCCCREYRPCFGIAEIIFFLNRLSETSSASVTASLVARERAQQCVFLGRDNRCRVWQLRPFACRVWGVHVRKEGRDRSHFSFICRADKRHQASPPYVDLGTFNSWKAQLDAVNRQYYEAEDPFWIRALTFSSWIAIYSAKHFFHPHLYRIQSILREHICLPYSPLRGDDLERLEHGLRRLLRAQGLFREKSYGDSLMEYTFLRHRNFEEYGVLESLFDCARALEELGEPSAAADTYREIENQSFVWNQKLSTSAKERLFCLTKSTSYKRLLI